MHGSNTILGHGPGRGHKVLLTGATGFVGSHLYPVLVRAGYEVVCGTRRLQAARQSQPTRAWVEMDAERPLTLDRALAGCDRAVYLIHAMAEAGDYELREREAARRFANAAERAGVERIVFLGGIAPQGPPSKHLRSRLATGEALRASSVSTVELRAGMVVGSGSASWNIVRDLALRLPVMVLPRWLDNVSEPVALDDVLLALAHALDVEAVPDGWYDLPGPARMTAREVLLRIARLNGVRPLAVSIPVVTPALSSHWIRLVSRANYDVARELVQGLVHDIIATGPLFWDLLPQHQLLCFDEAARIALRDDVTSTKTRARALESVVRWITPKAE